ncbi:MAG: hypothetical protein ACYDB4_17780 [Candidatus Dormibacteraceae bacterium]
MRPADSILAELRDLDEALVPFSEPAPAHTGADLMQKTLLARQAELREELVAALAGERQPALRLFFDGQPVSGHTVTAAFLGKAIDGLQSSLQALGTAMAGRLGARGPLADRFIEETQLRVTGFVPGSFGVLLEAPLGAVQQSMLTDQADLSLMERAAGRLLDVLELGSASVNDDALLDALGGLGVRPVNRLRDFADHMRNSEATFHLEWQSPDVPQRSIDMDRARIAILADRLASVEAHESTITVTGWLGGASLIRDRFELEADGQIYSGLVAPDLVESMPRFFNRRCEADIVVTLAHSLTSDRRSERYYLVALRLVREP